MASIGQGRAMLTQSLLRVGHATPTAWRSSTTAIRCASTSQASPSRQHEHSSVDISESASISLPGPLEPSRTLSPTHHNHVASLQLRTAGSHSVEDLDFFTDFAVRAAYALGISTSRPAALPMRKSLWTVPRGPFVHKKSQENFERRTHKRVLKVYDADTDVVDKWLHFLRIHAMNGVSMRAETFRFVGLGFGAQLLDAATASLRQIPEGGDAAEGVREATEATLRASEVDADKIRQLADGIVKDELETQANDTIDDRQSAIEDSEPTADEDANADTSSTSPKE